MTHDALCWGYIHPCHCKYVGTQILYAWTAPKTIENHELSCAIRWSIHWHLRVRKMHTTNQSRTSITSTAHLPPRPARMHFQQNDGSLDGIRYFLCHPNRGLFVRIARCRTRAGYSEVNERHVSFATRTLGKKVCDHGWSAKVPKRNRPFATGPRGVKNGSSSPHLTETSKEGSGTLTSRSAHRPQRVDARLNTTTWVAGDISETARGDLHRYGLNAPRQGTQPESDSPERVSSEISLSESDLCQVIRKMPLHSHVACVRGFAALESTSSFSEV